MKPYAEQSSPKPEPPQPIEFRKSPTNRRALTYFIGLVALLTLGFAIPLQRLYALALSSDLYSHTLLIPFVSIYLAWETNRHRPPNTHSKPDRRGSLLPLALGGVAFLTFFVSDANPANPEQIESYLAFSIFAYVCFIAAAASLLFGRATIKAQLFPLLFLVFLAPFPVPVRESIQIFFQHASAELAYWFIKVAGIPIFRQGLIFEMPTITMEVAPECSGIRSSLVLFIVSLVGSYFFLKSPWKRAALVALVIPLGILRNAIRIVVLAAQCYHIGPEMIDGWFHKHGGQPLFAVTLIPFFLILYLMRRSERTTP